MTRLSEATRIASTTAIIYFLVSALWILLSDRLLAVIVHNFADLQEFQTYKRWFFVSVTSLLLYSTLRVHIAKRRELEGHLLRAQRMENLGRLAGGIAHDLNNILGPVLLGSEVLVKSVQDERSRRNDLPPVVVPMIS